LKSSVTQEQVNTAQKAHIYAFSTRGPRGNRGIAQDDLNGLGNLMLVCHECHRKIDGNPSDARYAAALLRSMKTEHEQRIERISGISGNKKTHLLLYGANVGEHSSPLNYADAAPAVFPHRYPASDAPIDLTTVNSAFLDRDADFWGVEAKNLQVKFGQRVRERLAAGAIEHLSLFAIAPQPLLILLGTLLGECYRGDGQRRWFSCKSRGRHSRSWRGCQHLDCCGRDAAQRRDQIRSTTVRAALPPPTYL
jgi:hypothetical protein